MPLVLRFLIAGLVFLAPAAGLAAEFSDAQKTELHKIIRDYLVENPEVLQEASEALQAKNEADQLAQASVTIKDNADAIFRSTTDHVAGNPSAKLTIVEYFDYNCPYCKRNLPDVESLLKTNKDVRFVLKEFPILGEASTFAARAAIAARKQDKYWPLHAALMGSSERLDNTMVMALAKGAGLDVSRLKKDMEADDVSEVIKANHDVAQQLGINGTPAFIIDDQLVSGMMTLDQMQARLKDVQTKGCATC